MGLIIEGLNGIALRKFKEAIRIRVTNVSRTPTSYTTSWFEVHDNSALTSKA